MTEPEPQEAPPWSLAERVGFRFTFLYLTFYAGPRVLWAPASSASGLEDAWHELIDGRVWGPVVRWFAANVLHVSPTGGYTSYGRGWELLSIVCLAILAAILTVVWSYVDRRRREYSSLHRWFRVYLRFTVAVVLLNFGIDKIWLYQMGPEPSPGGLLSPPGLSPPRSLLWTFMATSSLYQGFAGVVEALAGALLMMRRTALLGALLSVAAMTNVVVIDWGYQVDGVGLFATHVLLMSIVLVIPDARRLADMFLFQRLVVPPDTYPLVAAPRLDRALRFAGGLFLVWVVAHASYLYAYAYPGAMRWWDQQRPPLYGAYDVDVFVNNRDTIPPLLTSQTRWRRFFVNSPAGPQRAVGQVQFMTDSVPSVVLFQIDTIRKKLDFWTPGRPADKASWNYAEPDPQHLLLTGPNFILPNRSEGPPAQPDSLRVMLRRIDLSTLPINRPRQWFR